MAANTPGGGTPGTRSMYLVIKHPSDVAFSVSGVTRRVLEFRQDTTNLPSGTTFQWDSASVVFSSGASSSNVPFTFTGTAPVLADFSESLNWLSFDQVQTVNNGGVLVVNVVANNAGTGRSGNITHTLPGGASTVKQVNQDAAVNDFNITNLSDFSSNSFNSCGETRSYDFTWTGTQPISSQFSVTSGGSFMSLSNISILGNGTGSFELAASPLNSNISRTGAFTYNGISQPNSVSTISFNQSGACLVTPPGGNR